MYDCGVNFRIHNFLSDFYIHLYPLKKLNYLSSWGQHSFHLNSQYIKNQPLVNIRNFQTEIIEWRGWISFTYSFTGHRSGQCQCSSSCSDPIPEAKILHAASTLWHAWQVWFVFAGWTAITSRLLDPSIWTNWCQPVFSIAWFKPCLVTKYLPSSATVPLANAVIPMAFSFSTTTILVILITVSRTMMPVIAPVNLFVHQSEMPFA